MLRLEKQKSKCPILVYMHKPLFLSQQNHANCIYEHEANSILQNKTCMAKLQTVGGLGWTRPGPR